MEAAPKDQELSRVRVEAVLEGDDFRDGSMEVEDFAPAMLGLAHACQRANYLINGDRARLSVRIQADVTNACFSVDLDLVSLASPLVPLLPHAVETAKGIAEKLFGDQVSVFEILKKLRGEKPQNVNESHGEVSLVIPGDNNKISINQNVYNCVVDPEERRHIARVAFRMVHHRRFGQ